MLKIDRSFILALNGSGTETEELVKTIITMARNLKLGVIAEGVETREHLRRLLDLGCEFGQGYLFSKPVDASAAEALLQHPGPSPAGQNRGVQSCEHS